MKSTRTVKTDHSKFQLIAIVAVGLMMVVMLLMANGRVLAQDDEPNTPTGEKSQPAEGRAPEIVGGNNADPGEYPWQALVFPGGFLCGGSLIDEEWVMTAAHCVFDQSGNLMSAGDVQVVLGEHDRNSTSGDEQNRSVTQVIAHPSYSPSTQDNDVALLKLSSPASIVAGKVETVPLNSEADISSGTLATVTGWGATSQGGSVASILQEVSVPVVTNQVCNAAYNGSITANMICAGFQQGGKDSCQGDSGGPFVTQNGSGDWVLTGVVSWGIGCAQPNYYGVYARVSQYVSWVEEQTGDLPDPTVTPTATQTATPDPTETPDPGETPEPTATPDPNETPEPHDSGLLINGNFDNLNFEGWTQFSSNEFPLIGSFENDINLDPLSAPYMVWLGGSSDETSEIVQSVSLPADESGNDTYTLKYHYQIGSADICGYDTAGVVINGTTVTLLDLCGDTATSDWVTAEIDLSAYAGQTIAIKFFTITDESAISSFFIDNASLTYKNETPPATETPVPGTGPIPNGDFELGSNGDWDEASELEYQLIFSVADGLNISPHAGSYFAWLGGADNERAAISQEVEVPAGTTHLAFAGLIKSNDFCGYDVAVVKFGDETWATYDLCNEKANDGWEQFSIEVSEYVGMEDTLKFLIETDGAFTSSWYLDDIEFLTEEPTEPEPEEELEIELVAESGSASIELEWSVPDDPTISTFKVYRKSEEGQSGSFSLIDSTELPFYSDDDESLEAGATYFYQVIAVRGDESTVAESNIASALFGQLTLDIPSIVAPVGTEDLIVPINLLNASGLEIISGTIYIDYNPAHITPISYETTQLTHDYETAGTIYTIEEGVNRLKMEMSSDDPAPIYGDGALVWLMFEVVGSVGDRSDLAFVKTSPASGGSFITDQNDGNIGLVLNDGQLEIVGEGDAGNSFGDINGDGVITDGDAQIALDYSVGNVALNEAQKAAGDVNGDGEVNAADAAMILYYVANEAWPSAEEGLTVELYEVSVTQLSPNAMNIGTTLSGVPVGGFEFTINVDPNEIAALNFTPLFTNILYAVRYEEDGKITAAMAAGSDFGDNLSSLGTITVTYNATRQVTAEASPVRLSDASLFSPSGLDYEENFPGQNGSLNGTELSSSTQIYLPLIVR
ncbi:MAG: trypsin-like serine protease [Anaerolineae bacterium]